MGIRRLNGRQSKAVCRNGAILLAMVGQVRCEPAGQMTWIGRPCSRVRDGVSSAAGANRRVSVQGVRSRPQRSMR